MNKSKYEFFTVDNGNANTLVGEGGVVTPVKIYRKNIQILSLSFFLSRARAIVNIVSTNIMQQQKKNVKLIVLFE